jgi:hypothetical protein
MSLDIVSYRLQNQHLSQNKFDQAADVVSSLGAVQSQDFGGAKWALGLRTYRLTDSDVQHAFDDGEILRTHVLRPTWHFVAPEDIRWMLALTAPRVKAQMAYVDRQVEIDRALLKKSNALLLKVLRGGNHLTRAELGLAFQSGDIPAEGLRLGQLLMHAELDALVCSGPRRGKQFTYALLEERVPPVKEKGRDESLAGLVRTYFLTRGPATFKDFCVWSGLTMADARDGMEMNKSQFVSDSLEGQTYWYAETRLLPTKKSPTAYLLPNYDEYFIGFKDRSAIAKVAEQGKVKKDDPAFLAHIIILDGQVVGGWKRILKKDSVKVQASLITKLTILEEEAVRQAAENFGVFLQLPVLFTHQESTDEQRTSRSF